MYVTVKLNLKPNRDQERRFFQLSGAARFCYNESLDYWKDYLLENGHPPALKALLLHIRDLKYGDMPWLQDIPESVQKQACRDLESAWAMHKKGVVLQPSHKRKGKCREGFYQRTDRIRFDEDGRVFLTGVPGSVRVGKNNLDKLWLFGDSPPMDPRVCFDGRHWNLTLVARVSGRREEAAGVPVGLSFGRGAFVTLSDGRTYASPDDDADVSAMMDRIWRLDRVMVRKYAANAVGSEFPEYRKTQSIKKIEAKLAGLKARLASMREERIHLVANGILSGASHVVVEDAVNGPPWSGELVRMLEYKAALRGIGFWKVDSAAARVCPECGGRCVLSGKDRVCAQCGIVEGDALASAKVLEKLARLRFCPQTPGGH